MTKVLPIGGWRSRRLGEVSTSCPSSDGHDIYATPVLIQPLALKIAQFAEVKDIIPGKATLYSRYIPDASRFEFMERNGDGVLSEHQMWIVPSLYPESVRAGAGLVMNALDLAKFDAALSAKGLLNAHTLETMWEPGALQWPDWRLRCRMASLDREGTCDRGARRWLLVRA